MCQTLNREKFKFNLIVQKKKFQTLFLFTSSTNSAQQVDPTMTERKKKKNDGISATQKLDRVTLVLVCQPPSLCTYFFRKTRPPLTREKFMLTGQNLGRVFKPRSGCLQARQLALLRSKTSQLKKTPKRKSTMTKLRKLADRQ